jgi:hypothetical protein
MSNNRCCGIECSTPFCPLCGRPMTESLIGLLGHIRAQQRKWEGYAKAWENGKETTVAMKNKSLAKWKSWGDQLEALLDSQPKGEAHES